ncbi:EamA family transporter [Cohnella lupini]|uniref:Threonine/homoserine efflux transporter RhtA n=1 Tax=Cohnella lupini TaxID=1294267 RepID=A0A3D9HY15_9BACL|nr:DMT family transporter [Cohnella lupini]RED54397.1 threonine/homoserine efflux transporter RhtA [Cohnella lupini]
MNNTKKPIWAIALVLIGATSYGFVSAVLKFAVNDGMDVKHLTFQQVLFGAVLLWLTLGVVRVGGRGQPSLAGTWKSWLRLSVIGILGLSLTTIFYNEALARLDASLVIVLLFQYTWITILLESIRKRQWPTKQEWIAVLCIALGTILAAGLLERDFSELDGLGIIFGLLSAVTYSLFFFLTGFLPNHLDAVAKSAMMSTASLLFVFILQLSQAPALIADSFNGTTMAWGLVIGFLGTAFPFFCFNYGIPKLGSGLAALLGSMELPAAVVAAFILLGEPLTLWQGAGIVLIIAGIMAAQSKPHLAATAGKEGEK